jgi:hypothetical protein
MTGGGSAAVTRRCLLAATGGLAAGAGRPTNGACPPRAQQRAVGLQRFVTHAVASTPPNSGARSDYLRLHRFFSDNSPWNAEIPTGTALAEVPGIRSLDGGISAWHPEWSNVAIYFAITTDPVTQVLFVSDTWLPIHSGKWLRSGNRRLVEDTIRRAAQPRLRYPGNPYSTQTAGVSWQEPGGLPRAYRKAQTNAALFARIPRDAEPAPDSDGNTVIVQPNGSALELYSPVKLSTGQWVSEMYSFTDALEGDGTGWENGRRASMIPCYAGVLRDIDVALGRIEHALALVAPVTVIKAAFTSPALAFDSDSSTYRGQLPMGARLALPRDPAEHPKIETDLGRMLATAALEYGMIIVDSGGEGITICTDWSARTVEAVKREPQLGRDITAIVQSSKVVSSS